VTYQSGTALSISLGHAMVRTAVHGVLSIDPDSMAGTGSAQIVPGLFVNVAPASAQADFLFKETKPQQLPKINGKQA
jgi:hypothetical protein